MVVLAGLIGLVVGIVPYTLLPDPHALRSSAGRAVSLGIAAHLGIALASQAMGMFTYPVILTAHSILAALILLYRRPHLAAWRRVRLDAVLMSVAILAILFLLIPHLGYTGPVAHTTSEATTVSNWHYPYPYYSDEWYAIAFANDSIESGHLPLTYPFTHVGVPFGNLEAAFHSLIAEIALLFGLTLLTHYVFLSVIINAGIVVLLYVLLRQLTVNPLPSAVAALSALFIVSAANLPGLWTLLPVTAGTVALLLAFVSIASRDTGGVLTAFTLTLLLYPPHVVLVAPALLVSVATKTFWSRAERRRLLLGGIGLLVASAVIVGAFYVAGSLTTERTMDRFIQHIVFNTLFYQTFTPRSIPSYPPHVIIPVVALVLALVGTPQLIRQARWLTGTLLLGAIFWLLYSQVTWRLVIEYQRVVFVTSLLVIVASGFGWQRLFDRVFPRIASLGIRLRPWHVLALIITVYLILLPSYTARDDWQQLVLVNQTTGEHLSPAAPANDYLQPEDLALFAPLGEQRFLSLPWKGTVIGVATSNHPLTTKTGTLSLDPPLAASFLQADCAGRRSLTQASAIDYVYLPPFNCPGFIPRGEGADGLWLYTTPHQTVN